MRLRSCSPNCSSGYVIAELDQNANTTTAPASTHHQFGSYSRDPIGYLAGQNLYRSYLRISGLDPTGLSWLDPNTGGAEPDSDCCTNPTALWDYWNYKSQAECTAHVLLMAALRPGGTFFSLGTAARAALIKALKAGNWTGIIALLGAGFAANKTAEITCGAEICRRGDFVAADCELYSYKPYGDWGWTCWRLHCECPPGSVLWDHSDPYDACNDTPEWDLEKLKEEAAQDWPSF